MNCIGNDVSWPYGWPFGSYPKPQGQYYCSVGARNSYGREITNAHYKACLYAGVKIYGTNAEVMPGQWEFQIGTCHGIEIGDHLWMGRYLLIRVAEMFGLDVSFDPKPISGDWNGSGGHLNYSDKLSRNDNKLESIKKQMKKLEDTHNRLIKLYGENNELRLTGNFSNFILYQIFFIFKKIKYIFFSFTFIKIYHFYIFANKPIKMFILQ